MVGAGALGRDVGRALEWREEDEEEEQDMATTDGRAEWKLFRVGSKAGKKERK